MRVALLGTGKMGAAIARRLAAAGFDIVLWNRTRERAEAVGAGRVAATPAEAASGAAAVLSIVTDAAAVRSAYFGLDPDPAQLIVEMSTAGVAVLEELAARFPRVLAAPVLGSVPAIEAGSALVYCGGSAADFEAARPVLSAFGSPELVGTASDAIGLKLVNNSMLAGCSLVAAELQAAGEAAGLDPERVFAILERTMPYLRARKRGYTEHDHQRPLFFLRDLVKDVDLALDLFHRSTAPAPLIALSRELYAAAVSEHGEEEFTAVIERYRFSADPRT